MKKTITILTAFAFSVPLLANECVKPAEAAKKAAVQACTKPGLPASKKCRAEGDKAKADELAKCNQPK